MKRLESLADALAFANKYYEPESRSYELRNPGLLSENGNGHRQFSCHRAGYASLMDALKKRCDSSPTMDLKQLLELFEIRMQKQQQEALDFLSRCLNTTAVKLDMKLRYFLENE